MASDSTTLPSEFADLETYAVRWSHPTQERRCTERWAATMADIQELYEAVVARLDDALQHLNRRPWPPQSPADERLFNLLLALAEVAPAVESFKAPGNPIARDFTTRYRLVRDDVLGRTEG